MAMFRVWTRWKGAISRKGLDRAEADWPSAALR